MALTIKLAPEYEPIDYMFHDFWQGVVAELRRELAGSDWTIVLRSATPDEQSNLEELDAANDGGGYVLDYINAEKRTAEFAFKRHAAAGYELPKDLAMTLSEDIMLAEDPEEDDDDGEDTE